MRQILWALLFSLIITSCGKDREISLGDKIDRQLQVLNVNDKPGVEVFVKRDTSIIYHKAFGKSNLQTNENLEINSVFNLASISKEFTAVSILQLVEQKKLNLTDSLHLFLPDIPSQYKFITVENLLSHTSGIKRHTDMSWAENEADRKFESNSDVIKYFLTDSLDFKPNTRHAYANMNYIILGHIIEKVSHMSYQDYLKQNIFDPLEMNQTFFPKDGQSIPNKPVGYEIKEESIVLARPYSYTQSKGPGSIHTTANDMARWYKGLISHKVISKESLDRAWSSYILSSGEKSNYGFGFYNDEKFGQTSIFHNGFIFGFSSSDLYFPKDDYLILVLSNISDINTINTNKIAFDIASVIYENATVQLDVELLDSYVGTYKMDEGFKAKVSREGLKLFISVDGGPADELSANTKTKFRVKDFPAKAEFNPSNDGGKMKIFLSNGSDQFHGVKE